MGIAYRVLKQDIVEISHAWTVRVPLESFVRLHKATPRVVEGHILVRLKVLSLFNYGQEGLSRLFLCFLTQTRVVFDVGVSVTRLLGQNVFDPLVAADQR